MKTSLVLVLLGTTLAAWSARAADKWDIKKLDPSKLPAPADKSGVTYKNDIRPIFQQACIHCHGEERHKGGLRLDSLQGALKGGQDGKVVIPGESSKSLLVFAVARVKNDIAMPPIHGPGGRGGPRPSNPPPQGQEEGQGGPGGMGQRPPGGSGRPGFGGPPKPLSKDQVALIRAWIDQGAK